MIISNAHRFIFIHINKTAGTSVTEALAPHLAWNDIVLGGTPIGRALDQPFHERFGLYKHSTAREIRAVVGGPVWKSYLSFAVLRDPVERTISLYRFLRRLEDDCPAGRKLLRRVLRRRRSPVWPASTALRESRDFSGFIHHPMLRYDPGFIPQHRFLSDEEGRIIVSRLLCLETLTDELVQLGSALGLRLGTVGHANRSTIRRGGRIEVTPTQEDIDYLRTYFAKDEALRAQVLANRGHRRRTDVPSGALIAG